MEQDAQRGSVRAVIPLPGGSCDERESRGLQGEWSDSDRIVTFQSGYAQIALDTMGVSA